MSDVTELLNKVNAGEDPHAAEKLLEVVYDELRAHAQAAMQKDRGKFNTIQATVLVHDAWLKLFPHEKDAEKFKNSEHFFIATGKAMRRILIDRARHRNALKRGKREDVSETVFAQFAHPAPDELIIAVNEALEIFAKHDEQTAKLVELRFFVGITIDEAAKILGISKRTAERNYTFFKAWFKKEFGNDMKRN